MDENNSTIEQIKSVGTFAITTTKDYPVQFDQYLSEAPTQIKTSVKVPRLRLTSDSALQTIARNCVIGSFDLNLPIKEPILRISSIYRVAYDMAFNYDRTHYDAFFDAYPELLVLAEGEDRPTTQEMKANVKTYVKRFVHKYYYYEVGLINLVAAMVNMLVLTRYDGDVPFKDIASHFRWSRLNSISGSLPGWFWPKGVFDFTTKAACYAVGRTTYGADIVCFPHFVTDGFGSRGAQAPDFMAAFSQDTTDANPVLFGGETGNAVSEGNHADNLLAHSYAIYRQYFCAEPIDDGQGTTSVPTVPNGYFIENGEFVVTTTSEAMELNPKGRFTNRHGLGPDYVPTDQTSMKNRFRTRGEYHNLLDSYYDAYAFWEDYLLNNFPEFRDPNSDIVAFFTKNIALLEQGHTALEMLNVVRANKNYDLTDLLSVKSYKRDNQPTTVSWMKYSLPIHRHTAVAGDPLGEWAHKGSWYDELSFSLNFERYPVDDNAPGFIIASAKQWPSNTPNTCDFPDEVNGSEGQNDADFQPYPLVPNALPAFGTMIEYQMSHSAPMIGKFATWFDRACSSSMAPEDSFVEGIGIDSSTLEDYVKRGGGIVFEENNTKIFVPEYPVFDSSDPYQCGVNVMIADQDTMSEWDKFLRNSRFFGPQEHLDGRYPTYNDLPCLTCEEGYRNALKHLFFFAGMGILHHPIYAWGLKNSGNPHTELNKGDLASSTKQYNFIKSFAASNKLIRKVITDVHDRSSHVGPNDNDASYTGAITSLGSGSGCIINDMMFNPAYGPVALTLAVNPLDEISQAAPQYYAESQTVDYVTDGTSYGAVDIGRESDNEVGYMGVDWYLMHMQTGVDVQKLFYQTGLRDQLSGFIDYFKFRQSRYANRVCLPTARGVREIHFKGVASWVLSLMSRSMAQFLGIEDLNPYWSSEVSKDTASIAGHQSINQTSAMPENPIVAQPRVANSVVKGGRNFSHKANTKSDAPERPRFTAGAESVTQSGKSHPNGNKRRHSKRGKSRFDADKSPDYITNNRDGINDDAKGLDLKGTPKEAPRKDPRGPADAAATLMN